MENQHRKIKGYRELTKEEINAMNDIKEKGGELGAMIEVMSGMQDIDHRWLAIGKTNIQQGLMALTRAVVKPDFF